MKLISIMNNILFIGLISSFLLSQSIPFIRGVDISMLDQIEDNGGIFYDNGIEIDPIPFFKSRGVNTVRLKIWHTPIMGYNNVESTLEMAERIKQSELDFLLNFHYSDTWSDPSNQEKPSAWQDLSFENLCDSIQQYSYHVITKLKNQNPLKNTRQQQNRNTQTLMTLWSCTKTREDSAMTIASKRCCKNSITWDGTSCY